MKSLNKRGGDQAYFLKLTFKPACPWRVKTRKGIKLLELPMLHHYNPDFYVAGGLIDSHLFHEINPIMIFPKTGEFFIKRGTPIAMLIPIQTEDLNLIIREHTKEDENAFVKQLYALSSTFNNKFRKYEKIEECR